MAKKKQSTRLSAEAIAALRSASYEGNAFVLTQENLPCYAEVKALMNALGGKWVPGRKAHVFGEGVEALSLVHAACDRGEIPASNPHDFFPTPAALVERLVGDADFSARWEAQITCAGIDGRPLRYLEPSGGAGALVAAIVARMRPQDELVVVELNPLLAANLRVRFPRATVIEADFLAFDPEEGFDLVLLNPPFAGKTYAKHVRHAFGMLRDRGLMAAIVPTSFLTHGDDFLLFAAEAGVWDNFGGKLFEGTDTPTSGLWLQNDSERFWRTKPYEGFQTQYAWNLTISASSDARLLARLDGARTFEQFRDILAAEVSKWLRDGSACRVDDDIAMDVLRALVEDYGADYGVHNLAALLPKPVTVAAEAPLEAPATKEPAEDRPPTPKGSGKQLDLFASAA